MTLDDLNIWEVAKGGWMAAAAIVAWIGKAHMKHDADRFHEVSEEVKASTELRLSQMAAITERLTEVSDKMQDNHTQILNLLLAQNAASAARRNGI